MRRGVWTKKQKLTLICYEKSLWSERDKKKKWTQTWAINIKRTEDLGQDRTNQYRKNPHKMFERILQHNFSRNVQAQASSSRYTYNSYYQVNDRRAHKLTSILTWFVWYNHDLNLYQTIQISITCFCLHSLWLSHNR